MTLVEAYESRHYPLDLPDPVEAIRFRMKQKGLTPKDLVPLIGRINRVYEVLSRRRPDARHDSAAAPRTRHSRGIPDPTIRKTKGRLTISPGKSALRKSGSGDSQAVLGLPRRRRMHHVQAPESSSVIATDLKQRLAAILAADVAGYSRLMALDERATVAALDAARAVFRTPIEANQGRVIDMAGDSVLAVFETATGAVSVALAVQQELKALNEDVPEDRRMRFRIGVHLGDVIEKADGTVYGDGVNIAARLQALAEPGGITVSESIRTAVKGKVGASFEDRGEQHVKNIAEPVRVFQVAGGASAGAAPATAAIQTAPPLPDLPSLAVLPFSNLSGDPEQDYFADGMVEEIITALARMGTFFVIARNSSFV